jgi:hypothetical protein
MSDQLLWKDHQLETQDGGREMDSSPGSATNNGKKKKKWVLWIGKSIFILLCLIDITEVWDSTSLFLREK